MSKQKTAIIEAELEHIRTQGGGILRPEDVVSFASDPETALHSEFEWDDTEAAHQFRLEQARRIIRVRVQVIGRARFAFRVYVSLHQDRKAPGGGYRTLVDVLADPDMLSALLSEAKRDADAFRQKYQRLRKLGPIFDAMDDVFSVE